MDRGMTADDLRVAILYLGVAEKEMRKTAAIHGDRSYRIASDRALMLKDADAIARVIAALS